MVEPTGKRVFKEVQNHSCLYLVLGKCGDIGNLPSIIVRKYVIEIWWTTLDNAEDCRSCVEVGCTERFS